MKKIIDFFTKKLNWKEFMISMLFFFIFFTLIAIGMVLSKIWSIFGGEIILFYCGGLIISFIINIFKQID